MTNVRVDINGQFNVNNPFSAFNSENVTIDRTLASTDAPRNWSSFCTDVDKALEEVTKVKASYKIFGPINIICYIGALFAVSVSIVFVTNKRVNAGMAKLEVVCQNHSGNGSRYVLCNEHAGLRSTRYFVTVMNYDTEGQQQEQVAVGTFPSSVPASSSSTYAVPQPSAPSTNPYLQAAPAPAPAPTTGNSIFDQLSK
eukprot:scaffold961_cov210-Chaetoceros_neogracile.AAC.1